jgi:hypothetical protein
MLRPTKHSHPDQTVISLSVQLLKRLKKERVEEYDSLRAYARKTVTGGDVLFLPTLNFLFLVGLINYLPKTDAIEFTGPQ